MKKKMIIILIAFILTITGLYSFRNTNTPSKSQNTNNENIYFNNQEAIYLRKTLNAYVKTTDNSNTNGLSDFDKSYYSSPFIVYEEHNSLAGGKQLEIIFVNKPDKMFTALVYKLAAGDYELKGFGQNTKVTVAGLEKIKTDYKQYFADYKYFY